MRTCSYNPIAPANPQSWNRYAYALNNPLTLTDPTGLVAFQPCQGAGPCSYDDNGCTVDGNSVPCNLAENWNNMPGGGGIVACPPGGCPQRGTYISPTDHLPYDLNLGVNGWQYTAPSGEEVPEDQTWEELALPDFNSTYNGVPTLQAAANWFLGNEPGIGGGPQPSPPLAGGTQVRSPTAVAPFYSQSYSAFVACEYGEVMGNSDQVGVTLAVNLAPLAALAWRGPLSAGKALGVMAAYDIAGAWAINRICSTAVYGNP